MDDNIDFCESSLADDYDWFEEYEELVGSSNSDSVAKFDHDSDSINTSEYNDSSQSSDSNIVTKKKRRKRYVVNLFPRIVKSDIRRFYPRMLGNIANSLDPSLMRSFMRTYFLPQFYSLDILPEQLTRFAPSNQSKFLLEGLEKTVKIFTFQFDLIPDSAIQLIGSTITQFRDDPKHSELTITMQFRGTKLYEVVDSPKDLSQNPPDDGDQKEVIDTARELDGFLDTLRLLPNAIAVESESNNNFPIRCESTPLLFKRLSPKPFSIVSTCHLRIRLDENNRFCYLESSYSF